MAHESVWDSIEFDPAVAANMKERSALMIELRQYIDQEGLSKAGAAKLFRVPLTCISDLQKGKINSLEFKRLHEMKANTLHRRPADRS
uniref:XRE family transcriptional regulator n=1 Tax=Pseudomonas sp. GLE121 TaxID=1329969 RepID=UPI001566658B|nr:XRE family transcriptional regulator [Pseudomonas sp. GLE121]